MIFRVRDGALEAQSAAGTARLVANGGDRFDAPGMARLRFERDAAGVVARVTIEMGEQRYDAERVV